jgi:hypothetical protein
MKAAMRVVVLGAGASRHAGYPLAAEMGNCLAAWINTLSCEHQYRLCLAQITKLYGGLGNFETILADLVTATPGSRAAGLGVRRPYLLSDLKEALRDHFDSIRSTPAPLYDGLARVLRPGDSVITFNYDLGVERALRTAGLWDIKTGYGFLIENGDQPSPVEVLKLHGSTNWRALLFGGRTGFFAGGGNSLGNRPVLFFRPDLEYLGYRDFVDPRCAGLDTAASLPAMIMPALPKTFYFTTTYGDEWKGFWDHLWNRAGRAISNADEVIVIGYSLPLADERARNADGHDQQGHPLDDLLWQCDGAAGTGISRSRIQRYREGCHDVRRFSDYRRGEKRCRRGRAVTPQKRYTLAFDGAHRETGPFEDPVCRRGRLHILVGRSGARSSNRSG